MALIQAGLIGPQADGTTPQQNPLDTRRHEYWANSGGKSGIIEGFVASVVAGQMQLSFTAGSAAVRERNGSNVELSRAYPVWADVATIVQFGAASASNRNDAVVAAVVDVEDGAQGTGAIGVGGHLVVIPGVSGTTTPRTDAQIQAYLGRGGFHRLYDVPIATGSTQINLAGATFTGFKINAENAFADIPFTLTAGSGFSIQSAWYRLESLIGRVTIRLEVTRTGATLSSDSDGNMSIGTDPPITTNWPTLLTPSVSRWVLGTRQTGAVNSFRVTSSGLELTHLITPNSSWPSGATSTVHGAYHL